jgi:hypothetical protein
VRVFIVMSVCALRVSPMYCVIREKKKNSVYVFHSLTHSSEAAKSMFWKLGQGLSLYYLCVHV